MNKGNSGTRKCPVRHGAVDTEAQLICLPRTTLSVYSWRKKRGGIGGRGGATKDGGLWGSGVTVWAEKECWECLLLGAWPCRELSESLPGNRKAQSRRTDGVCVPPASRSFPAVFPFCPPALLCRCRVDQRGGVICSATDQPRGLAGNLSRRTGRNLKGQMPWLKEGAIQRDQG